ncbi:MAG TPA: sugar phosphate isomerase/epimerase [Candidatus Gallacutalibacter stercoravium]|nr:sugar phosphate isomerase/epimerase [Candidatus Gallacutalibacter stercoravium]
MRLGGSVEKPYNTPAEWLAMVRALGYSAVSAPVDAGAPARVRQEYLACARENNLLIGEVGAWSSPLSTDEKKRAAALRHCKEQLALADELGANCCVNISGARGPEWADYYPLNYAADTYTLIVDTVREIIDAVKPTRTYYALEPMPWMLPDSVDGYLALLRDVDRPAFAVHLDYTNLINSLEKYHNSSLLIQDCFARLGPYIKSVHAKDVILDGLPCCIRETPPGTGIIDFGLVLRLTHALGPDTPLFVEHLTGWDAYRDAARFIRAQAKKAGVPVVPAPGDGAAY